MKKALILGSIFAVSSVFGLQVTSQKVTTPTSPTSPLNAPSLTNGSDLTKTQELKDRFTTTNDHKLGSQIHVQVAELIGAPNATHVILVIDDGHVKLTGKAPSEETKTKINQSVQQIKGVKSVQNLLEVEKK